MSSYLSPLIPDRYALVVSILVRLHGTHAFSAARIYTALSALMNLSRIGRPGLELNSIAQHDAFKQDTETWSDSTERILSVHCLNIDHAMDYEIIPGLAPRELLASI